MKNILILVLLIISATTVRAQTLPNDCVRAVTVCGNGTFFSNADGIGAVQDINPPACGSFEHNSLWLKITIAPWVIAGSSLGFNLIPDDPSLTVDYDFWVFGFPNTPTTPVCGALGSPIRCNTTNPGPSPGGANLSSNVTGLVGTTLATTGGPGSLGTGFVRWLTVSPGQTYYIAIDRPSGNGGFQIQWTGTATSGLGAFPTPPTANPVADVKTCSNTPNVGIFDLNSIRPIINSDLINNTISFHTTISNAIDNISPLPNIYANTSNPQIIYVRVTDNLSGCFSTTSFNLVVNLVPNATLSVSSNVICNGNSITVTYAGTPGATFNYTIDGGPIQTSIFPASGLFILNETLNSTRTYTLNGVRNLDSSGIIICNQPLNITRTVTVNQQPDAGLDAGVTICAISLIPLDLFSLITGEQTGGVWTRTSGTGGVFDSALGTFTPTAGATTSTFEYTLLGVAPCITDVSVATINIGGQPDAGINGATTICESSSAIIDLFSLITGEQTGGVWTRTSGTGGIFNAGAGTFTPAVGATTSTFDYTLLGIAPCITDTSLVTINITPQPIAGTDGATTICETSPATIDLFGLINGEQTGGVWTRTSGTGGVFNAGIGTFTPSVGATTSTFDYSLLGVAPCVTDTSIATINIIAQPIAGTDSATTICETSIATIDLFSLIIGEQIGGTWTRTSGIGGIFNAGTGTFTPAFGSTTSTFDYILLGVAPCVNDVSVATINITAQPVAGIDGATTICETSSATIDLFNIIIGEQAGGTWTRTSGIGGVFNAGAGTFTPAVGATTSTFDYTLLGIAPCINDVSVATINIISQPIAGIDGATTICETSSTSIDLFSLITGEQTGGTWIRTSGTGGVFNAGTGTFTPAVGATTSTFTYTLLGVAPCITDTSLSTINIIVQPIAGTDGATTICETSSASIDLFSLITGEQTGGTWTRTSGTGGLFNAGLGTFTPSVGATTSTFDYTLLGVAPCITDTSIATINLIAQPIAGTDSATTICETSSTSIDLFSLITGEQTGGTWTRTSGTGGVFNAGTGTFTPAVGATTSTFTYALLGVTPCITDTSVATISINQQPNAGLDGGVTICAISLIPIDLFSLITGEQSSGVWTRTSGTGGIFNAGAGAFTPTAGATTSTFEYTLLGIAPCINDVSIATINIGGQPDAGINGSTTICETSSAIIDLFSLITGEQIGGVWIRTTGTGGVFNAGAGTFTPAVGSMNSTFTYTLLGVAPCVTDISVATINIIAQPIAGTDGATTICENSSATIDLFSLITGEQTGGVWTRSSGTGGLFNAGAGTFTPAVGAITSTFTYTLVGIAPCINSSSLATITINPQPNAGIDGTTTVCETSIATIDLFSLITGEQTGGVWTRTSGIGGVFNAGLGSFAPSVGATSSTFDYTLLGVAPCINDVSVATINITAQPVAGIDGSTTICETSFDIIDLFSLITGEQTGGTWTRTSGIGGIFNAVAGTFTPAIGATTSTFTYTLLGVAPCINATSLATITINTQPNAGTDGATTVCETSSATIDLFGLIIGEQTGGTWTRTSGTGGVVNAGVGTFTPAVGATTSTFTYTLLGVSPCINATSLATITINSQPNAGTDGATTICETSSTSIDLFGLITGEQTGGVWTRNSGTGGVFNATSGTYTPAVGATTSTFIYTLLGVAPCITDTSVATININTSPTIFTPTNYVVCDDSNNNDGFYCGFDLTTITNQITGGNPGVVVTYHETLTNSQTGANPIVGLYCNIDSGLQTIYVRAYTLGSPACYSNTTFNLIVNPLPLVNPVITNYELCDYTSPGDNTELFTLNTKTAEITNGQSNVTITYYASQGDATSQTNALPNLYSNTSNPQQIWINIRNNTTGCNTVSSFNLVVNSLPQVTLPDPIFQCSNGTSTQALFDLTLNEAVVTGGVTGLTITYYNTLLDAQNETSPISTPLSYTGTDNEIVYLRVENNTTGCYATTTQLLRVTQGPIAITPQTLRYCDPNNDGFGVFNLEDATTEIAGGVWPLVGVSIGYYETQTDALLGTNPSLTSPYSNINPGTQTIYVRVYYTLTGCANYVQLQLLVDPTPEATTPSDYALCDYTGATGFEGFDLTTTVPQILGAIDPALTTVTFHTAQADANADTNAISNLTSYINQTIWNQTLYVRVETIATGCYDTVELELIVNPIPNSLQPNYPQYSLCDTTGAIGFETFDLASQVVDILLGQTGMSVTFYPSLTDAQNATNAITNLQYQNQIIYVQTLGIKITNTNTGCSVISTMDIRVEPLPTPIPPTQPYTLCDDNQDGFMSFDLTTLIPDLLQGALYTITFHETLSGAQLGSSPINTTVLYDNINPFVQLLYVRAVDPNTGCWSVITIELNVNPSPIAPITLADITVCDNDNNPQNAITGINLTQRTPDVLAQQPAGGSYTVTYYNSQLAAQQGTAPIIPATNYIGTNGETIWVRVEDNTTSCYNLGSFQLVINTPLLLATPTPLNVCDDDANPNNQYHSFDLTVKTAEITQNLPGYTVRYYPSLSDAQNNTNVITTPTAYTNIFPAVQTLGVVVTTPAPANCQSITTLDIRVLPVPTPRTNPPSLGAKCDDNNPGDLLELFNLTLNAAYIANGDPNVTLHYFPTQADAQNNVVANEILNPTAALVGANVWIRVENNRVDYQGNRCAIVVEQPLTVNPLPTVIQPLAPYRVCDNDADGIAIFDLTNPQLSTAILGATQLPANYTISYYATAVGANPITNTGQTPLPANYQNVTPNTQNIYIRVVNNSTGCVNATGVLILAVEQYAQATGPQTFASCDDYLDPYDGVFQLDLTQYNTAILNGQNPAVFLISYYNTQADAIAGTNAIPLAQAQAYITTPDTDQIWVKVENSSNSITPLCYALTTINITIERYPNPIITTPNGVDTICVDYTSNVVVRTLTLNSGITNATAYTFEWFEDNSTTPIAGATGPTYTVDTASPTGATRTYTVRATSVSPLGCATTSAAFSVIQSGQAAIPVGTVGYTVTNAFTNTQIITVTIEGYGTYEYSLDDGPRQTSNIFENVSLGSHTIRVWDTEGGIYSCEELVIQDVQIIDYPHYFTPNGDGIHDTWNIVGLAGQPSAKIYIFDRYGKLLKQISSAGQGWDGTYNGQLLPSTDYWFSVDYLEQNVAKQFKAHFSLKR